MPKTIIANWKMRLSVSESLALAKKIDSKLRNSKNEIILCPDFLSLPLVSALLKNSQITVGGQDCALNLNSSSTGEISALNLKEVGASYVIIGHSERRENQKENSKTINLKTKAALLAGLKVILCVGESASCRKKGDTWNFISTQLKESLLDLPLKKKDDLLIAYEPIWAIGADRPMDADEADKIAEKISRFASDLLGKKIAVLYGGSVNSQNAKSYLKKKNISGLLVGGASLEADEFSSLAL